MPLLVFVLTLASAGAAHADSWLPGAVITYNRADWKDNPAGAALLVADYPSVYAPTLGVVTVGLPNTGFTLSFDGSSNVLAFLPQFAPPGVLTGNLVDPTATPAGAFAAGVLALQLNVDFSNAGFLVGTSGIPFGNLVLTNFNTLPNLNGLTVSQYLGDANTCLGGGACIDSVSDLDNVAGELDGSFDAGVPSAFAQTNLVAPTTTVPEPSSLLLVATGLLGLGWTRRFKRAP